MASPLDWGNDLAKRERLGALLARHGVELRFEFDPTVDAPIALPAQTDWPNLGFVSPARVAAAHEQLQRSFTRPLPALERLVAAYRTTLGHAAEPALAQVEQLLRACPDGWEVESWLMCSDGASAELMQLDVARIGENVPECLEQEGVVMLDTMRAWLAELAPDGLGLVYAAH